MANINKRLKKNTEHNKELKESAAVLLDQQEKKEKRKHNVIFLMKAAVIAAVYFGLTFAFPFMSYGMIQFRVSEILVALVFFEPAATTGLCIGCFFANLIGPGSFYDAVIGTCATGFGLYIITWYRSHGGKPIVGMLLYAFFNAFIVSLELSYITGVGDETAYIILFLWVMLGETVTSVGGGSALYHLLKKRWKDIVGETETSEE